MTEEIEDKTTVRVGKDLRNRVKKLRRMRPKNGELETQEEVLERLVKKEEKATDRHLGRG